MNIKKIARVCKNARLRRGVMQKDVAVDLHCSTANVSAFEHGENNNAVIFNYYLTKLFDKYDFELLGGLTDYDIIGNFFNGR